MESKMEPETEKIEEEAEDSEFGVRNSESDGEGDSSELGIRDSESDGEGDSSELGIRDSESGETGKKALVLIDPVYKGLLPVSILAALIGALLGLIPAAVFAYLSGIVFYPLFVAAPLLAFLFNKLLKGGCDIRALIVIIIFSLASAYITALSCQAALYTSAHNMPIYQIPLLVTLALGEQGVLPASASAYIYPLVFTALGIFLTWELLYSEHKRRAAEPGDFDSDTDADSEDADSEDDDSKEADADLETDADAD